MKTQLGPGILKILKQTYPANELVSRQFNGLDLSFKTDAGGRPVLLFLGKEQEDGHIKGERYVRVINAGTDHWELKGKAR
ncbi:hypothetical protein [Mucilaginibacter sp. L3T2-6]|uniref:hypothetical protein n=1 Tax=Mucilaginibacter sp. L3T2-6 TaxID=3062491 RepID=UPI00267472EE|nr:hypothetical protein [Mucilaginibacter sp. L3T2-6]MDO3643208.1 hypothetical protein [Mucilaginibacter sp. L3T2-6]MDV6215532.1 hypothetical protein [Mucilaginibacter sp. L3T2-6]